MWRAAVFPVENEMSEQLATSVLVGPQAQNLVQNYATFLTDPDAVEGPWRRFFEDLSSDAAALLDQKVDKPAAPVPGTAGAPGTPGGTAGTAASGTASTASRSETLDSIRALMMIRAYRVRGHLQAKLDPLGLVAVQAHPELDPTSYGFSDADMDRPIFIDNVLGFESATLREILAAVQSIYCGSIGVEFMHIQDPEQKRWIQERIENTAFNRTDFTVPGKRAILERLTAAECF